MDHKDQRYLQSCKTFNPIIEVSNPLTLPMCSSPFCPSLPYFKSNRSSLAKSRTEVDICPVFRRLALYPKVRIRARQISGSSGRKVNGQNRSGFLCLDQVSRLVPPRPWMNTMSALWPFSGVYTTFSPSGPGSDSLVLRAERLKVVTAETCGREDVDGTVRPTTSSADLEPGGVANTFETRWLSSRLGFSLLLFFCLKVESLRNYRLSSVYFHASLRVGSSCNSPS